jgi:2-polyprenyl-3-methyl-5-hydroxy-6-metoxy-1,4-benzoquinol methylase
MKNDYWVSFWKAQGQKSVGQDAQLRILRTSNKEPISQQRWHATLDYIQASFPVDKSAVVLDLCAGNGLFSRAFAEWGAKVTAVDVSAELLSELEARKDLGINTVCQDMRELDFPKDHFSHIFLYAGIQYVSHAEAVLLLKHCHEWLQSGGQMMIGDIPDAALQWSFYDTPERRAVYFDNLQQGTDIIGTWFDRDWLVSLAEYVGFNASTCDQPASQIYSHFRFDAFLKKP